MTDLWKPERRPLIVGQAPARGNEGLRPFAGKSGARLARLAGVGTDGSVLPHHFDLVNLLSKWPGQKGKGDAFPMLEARFGAADCVEGFYRRLPSYILLMGRKVADAFELDLTKFLKIYKVDDEAYDSHRVILFPHPSGINQWYNDKENRQQAAMMLRRVLHASPGG